MGADHWVEKSPHFKGKTLAEIEKIVLEDIGTNENLDQNIKVGFLVHKFPWGKWIQFQIVTIGLL